MLAVLSSLALVLVAWSAGAAAQTCTDDCWGAAVAEQGQDFQSVVVDEPTEARAISVAQASCGDGGCAALATVKNGCVSLAVDVIPYDPVVYAGGTGATKDAAQQAALAACQARVGQACVEVNTLCTFNVAPPTSPVHPVPRPILDEGSPEANAIITLLNQVSAWYLQNDVGISADGAKRLAAYGPVGTVDELDELLTGHDVATLLAYVRSQGLVDEPPPGAGTTTGGGAGDAGGGQNSGGGQHSDPGSGQHSGTSQGSGPSQHAQ